MKPCLCQGLNCIKKEKCLRFLRIEEETARMVVGQPWMAFHLCRPGYYPTENDHPFFIEDAPVAQSD